MKQRTKGRTRLHHGPGIWGFIQESLVLVMETTGSKVCGGSLH